MLNFLTKITTHMKKLFLISISFIVFSNSLQACCCYDSGQDDYHRLHYFMSQIFLDSKLNNLAIDGEWRKILKKETPYKFISKKYAEKLDSLYLNSGQPNSFIDFYENSTNGTRFLF